MFLGTSLHFSSHHNPLSELLSSFHNGKTLFRPHPPPLLPTLITSIAPKTSRPRPHSSQRTNPPPFCPCKRTQHNRIHRVRNPRSFLPLRQFR